jgi:hypothetical protein
MEYFGGSDAKGARFWKMDNGYSFQRDIKINEPIFFCVIIVDVFPVQK